MWTWINFYLRLLTYRKELQFDHPKREHQEIIKNTFCNKYQASKEMYKLQKLVCVSYCTFQHQPDSIVESTVQWICVSYIYCNTHVLLHLSISGYLSYTVAPTLNQHPIYYIFSQQDKTLVGLEDNLSLQKCIFHQICITDSPRKKKNKKK